MKAEAAIITINDISVLKILLQPETDAERKFLVDAAEKCEDYEVSLGENK